jgi:hypothetical protein
MLCLSYIRIKYILYLSLIVSITAVFSCKTARKIPHSPLTKKTAQELSQLITLNEFKYDWINAKLSANIITKDKDQSVTINLRIRKDSAIWMSVSPALGIEVARVLITKDSIKIMDRLNSKYIVTNYNYINDLLQVQVDFDMLQSLLTGNNFSYLNEKKFKSAFLDGDRYVLSTLGKRRLKKTIVEDKEITRGVVQDTWVDPEYYKVVKMLIKDKKNNKQLISTYQDHRVIENQRFPFVSTFDIESYKTVKVKIEYSKIVINKLQEFPFTIPDKYAKM